MTEQLLERKTLGELFADQAHEARRHVREASRIGSRDDAEPVDHARHGGSVDDRAERFAERAAVTRGYPAREGERVRIERSRPVRACCDRSRAVRKRRRSRVGNDEAERLSRSERHAHDIAEGNLEAARHDVRQRAIDARGTAVHEDLDQSRVGR
jgi:hypothetical protein